MTSLEMYKDLPILEVPPELQGLSDEEILKRSENDEKKVKHRGASRLSKKERQEKKMAAERSRMQQIVARFDGNDADAARSDSRRAPDAKMATSFRAGFARERIPEPPKSEARKRLDALFAPAQKLADGVNSLEKKVVSVASGILKPLTSDSVLRPASGRVLKGSFGANRSEQPKAVVVSAAQLERERMEERAKKVREALMKKKLEASGQAAAPEGAPVKRPRGRPRKNPL